MLFSYFGDKKNSGTGDFVYYRIALILTLSYMTGMGGDLYEDHQSYKIMYKYIDTISLQKIIGGDLSLFKFVEFGYGETTEIGFVILCLFFKILGLSDVGMFFIIAVITNTLLVKSYYRFEHPVFIFLIFISSSIFYQQANLVRQMLVVSISIYSLKYVVNQQLLRFLLCIVIAVSFHRASIFMIMFIPFCFNIDVYKNARYALFFLWCLSIFVAFKLIVFDMSLLLLYDMTLSGYESYMTNEANMGILNVNFSLVLNFFVLLFFLFYKRERKKDVYAYYFVLGTIISNISVQIANLSRVAMFFSVVNPAYIPYLLYATSKQGVFSGVIKIVTHLSFIYYLFYYIRVSEEQSKFMGISFRSVFELF